MFILQSQQKISVKLNNIILKITAFLFFIFFIFVNQAISQSFERGDDAANAGDFATALKEWKPLAENGDVKAQASLGFMYLEGKGVPKDYEKAEKWFKEAAEQGSIEAQFLLGQRYLQGDGFEKNIEQSLVYLSLAAEQDFAPAQFLLGSIYQSIHKPWDEIEATKWWIRSAEQGFPPAMRELGKKYQKDGWLADNHIMQEVGLMWSVIAMLVGDETAEFYVQMGENRLSEESIARVRILVEACFKKDFVGCEN